MARWGSGSVRGAARILARSGRVWPRVVLALVVCHT